MLGELIIALQVVHESFQRILEMRDEETGGRLRADLGTPVWELLTLEHDDEAHEGS